jgi:hypothetical protein
MPLPVKIIFPFLSGKSKHSTHYASLQLTLTGGGLVGLRRRYRNGEVYLADLKQNKEN